MRERRTGPYSKRGAEMGTKPRHRAQKERSAYTDGFLGGGRQVGELLPGAVLYLSGQKYGNLLVVGGGRAGFEEVKAQQKSNEQGWKRAAVRASQRSESLVGVWVAVCTIRIFSHQSPSIIEKEAARPGLVTRKVRVRKTRMITTEIPTVWLVFTLARA